MTWEGADGPQDEEREREADQVSGSDAAQEGGRSSSYTSSDVSS